MKVSQVDLFRLSVAGLWERLSMTGWKDAQIIYNLSCKYINSFDINSPIKINGSNMVDTIFKDFPNDRQAAVVLI